MAKHFNPGLPLTCATLFALIGLVYLGTWQANKIGPKTALVDKIQAGLTAEPIPLPVHLDDPGAVEFLRFSFSGTMLDREPIRVIATNRRGEAGYHVYMPVEKAFGRAVIVNLGWMPLRIKDLPPLGVGESVEITGVLKTSAVAGTMTPENDPTRAAWYRADVHEMAAFWGLGSKDYYHFRLYKDHEGGPRALPRGSQVRVRIPNDHLEYALTWYGLGAALIGVYIAFGIKRARESIEK